MTERIIAFIRQNLLVGQDEAPIPPDEDLLGSGLVDSIGMMQLIAHLESEYGLKVPPEDLTIENFMTPEAISRYLKARGVQANTAPAPKSPNAP
ncbi:MAG: acyl carrier protein [Bacteroidetes bacterium]|nr:MAG: acyl carrier protein [Bacteroidota bacterium]